MIPDDATLERLIAEQQERSLPETLSRSIP